MRATGSLESALADRELVICAVASRGVREVMRPASEFFPEEAILDSTVKGIESGTSMRMDQVFEDVLDPVCHPGWSFQRGLPSPERQLRAGRRP